jgi:nitroreductase
MKKMLIFIAFAIIVQPVFAQARSGPIMAIINHYAARNFLPGAIPKADLDMIIEAGVKAPSAGNRQPWHFTVVQDPALAKKLLPANVDGNVLIVISAPGDGKTNVAQILDCALAAQNIYLAAQALGYGSRQYTGPISTINTNFKTELGLPAGYNAVIFVRLGRVEAGIDAVSAASVRKKNEEVVTYK